MDNTKIKAGGTTYQTNPTTGVFSRKPRYDSVGTSEGNHMDTSNTMDLVEGRPEEFDHKAKAPDVPDGAQDYSPLGREDMESYKVVHPGEGKSHIEQNGYRSREFPVDTDGMTRYDGRGRVMADYCENRNDPDKNVYTDVNRGGRFITEKYKYGPEADMLSHKIKDPKLNDDNSMDEVFDADKLMFDGMPDRYHMMNDVPNGIRAHSGYKAKHLAPEAPVAYRPKYDEDGFDQYGRSKD